MSGIPRDIAFVAQAVLNLATPLEFLRDNDLSNSRNYQDQEYRAELAQRDAVVREALTAVDLIVDLPAARALLERLQKHLPSDAIDPGAAANGAPWTEHETALCIRLLQYKVLAASPVRTRLHGARYAWAGHTLKELCGEGESYSEIWPFFSDLVGIGPAAIAETEVSVHGRQLLGPVTMRDLVMRVPSVLGTRGIDPVNGNQKYFFVKLLDPSDFLAATYVGFNLDTVARLGPTPAIFKERLAGLLWKSRQAAGLLLEMCRSDEGGRVATREQFEVFKSAYKAWANRQSRTGWIDATPETSEIEEIVAFAAPDRRQAARASIEVQRSVLEELAAVMHRFDFVDDEAILIESPTFHGIFGLSLQAHPRQDGNFYPKDELWIYKRIALPDGAIGWVLVEPQRTFDKTESGIDPFTPFEWSEAGLRFRKREIMGAKVTADSMRQFVEMIDTTARPREHYVRTVTPLDPLSAAWTAGGGARWCAVVDDAVQPPDAVGRRPWPYFSVRELRFKDAGDAVMPLQPGVCFVELHATRGHVELTLTGQGREGVRLTITPARPLFLPACLPYSFAAFNASAPAELLVFTRS